MVSNTTTATTSEYFESADLYFEPDDPAVSNPEDFSPHQRFRSFLSRNHSKRWHSNIHHHRGLKTGNHHLHPNNHHTAASPSTNRYFFTTSTAGSGKPTHAQQQEVVIHHFSESLASLARTSTSSSEDDGENKDEESCCHSLTYSVESDRHLMLPFEEDDHQYLTGPAPSQPVAAAVPSRLLSESDVYTDDTVDSGRNSILWMPVPPVASEQQDAKQKEVGCFQWRRDKTECFHPLAWIGDAFRLLIRNAEERKLEESRQ